jgi:hypothetical protein
MLISPTLPIRRLLVQGCKEQESTGEKLMVPATLNMSHVRSFIVSGDSFNRTPPLSRFSAVRVLSMKYFPSKNNQPNDIRSLHHLRYRSAWNRASTRNWKPKASEDFRFVAIRNKSTSIEYFPATTAETSDYPPQMCETTKWDWESNVPSNAILCSWKRLATQSSWDRQPYRTEDAEPIQVRITMWREYEDLSLESIQSVQSSHPKIHWQKEADMLPRLHTRFSICFSQVPLWFSSISELSDLSIIIMNLGQDHLQLLGVLPILNTPWQGHQSLLNHVDFVSLANKALLCLVH